VVVVVVVVVVGLGILPSGSLLLEPAAAAAGDG